MSVELQDTDKNTLNRNDLTRLFIIIKILLEVNKYVKIKKILYNNHKF